MLCEDKHQVTFDIITRRHEWVKEQAKSTVTRFKFYKDVGKGASFAIIQLLVLEAKVTCWKWPDIRPSNQRLIFFTNQTVRSSDSLSLPNSNTFLQADCYNLYLKLFSYFTVYLKLNFFPFIFRPSQDEVKQITVYSTASRLHIPSCLKGLPFTEKARSAALVIYYQVLCFI